MKGSSFSALFLEKCAVRCLMGKSTAETTIIKADEEEVDEGHAQ